jgi:hypothetical protein
MSTNLKLSSRAELTLSFLITPIVLFFYKKEIVGTVISVLKNLFSTQPSKFYVVLIVYGLVFTTILMLVSEFNRAISNPEETFLKVKTFMSEGYLRWQTPDKFQKFIAVLSIIFGCLLSMTGLGVILGIPLIIFGVATYFYGGLGAIVCAFIVYLIISRL